MSVLLLVKRRVPTLYFAAEVFHANFTLIESILVQLCGAYDTDSLV